MGNYFLDLNITQSSSLVFQFLGDLKFRRNPFDDNVIFAFLSLVFFFFILIKKYSVVQYMHNNF